MDFCIDIHVVIDFPQKTIINADDEESATEVAVVNGRPNIESSIDSSNLNPQPRNIWPSTHTTAGLHGTSRYFRHSDPTIHSDQDLCPNQVAVEGTTFCNEVYGLFSIPAEQTNNGRKASSSNNPNECNDINSAIAEGKYGDTDVNMLFGA
jgi:hypothetical protein